MYIAGKGQENTGPGTSLSLFSPPNYKVGMAGCGCDKYSGLGLFDSGMDFTAWGWQEWFAVGIGGYVLTSMLFTTRRAGRQISEGVGKRVRGARRKLGKRISGD